MHDDVRALYAWALCPKFTSTFFVKAHAGTLGRENLITAANLLYREVDVHYRVYGPKETLPRCPVLAHGNGSSVTLFSRSWVCGGVSSLLLQSICTVQVPLNA